MHICLCMWICLNWNAFLYYWFIGPATHHKRTQRGILCWCVFIDRGTLLLRTHNITFHLSISIITAINLTFNNQLFCLSYPLPLLAGEESRSCMSNSRVQILPFKCGTASLIFSANMHTTGAVWLFMTAPCSSSKWAIFYVWSVETRHAAATTSHKFKQTQNNVRGAQYMFVCTLCCSFRMRW